MQVFQKLRSLSWQQLLVQEALPLGASLLMAEQLFHFGSFTLECLSFIGLWHGTKVIVTKLSKSTGDV